MEGDCVVSSVGPRQGWLCRAWSLLSVPSARCGVAACAQPLGSRHPAAVACNSSPSWLTGAVSWGFRGADWMTRPLFGVCCGSLGL